MVERVDFYVLQAASQDARWDFACRLTEKAYKLGNRVILLIDDDTTCAQLDEHLWAFRPESFVPHAKYSQSLSDGLKASPVLLAVNEQPQAQFDLCVNLASKRPGNLHQYGRLAEVVIQEPQVLLSTRQQFSYYKSLNLPLNTHKL